MYLIIFCCSEKKKRMHMCLADNNEPSKRMTKKCV